MEKIYNYFKKVSEDNKIGHAFLIGNTTYAECKEELEKVLSDFLFYDNLTIESRPDIYVLEPESNSITKSQIKELLVNISTTSQMNGKKVYILTSCENLSDTVYNALLKTIEEPEDNIYAFLFTSNIENVGSTIRSRCQTIFVSSGAGNETNKEMYDIALDIVKSSEKNQINSIAKNNQIYSIISNRDIFKKVIKEIFNIYMHELYIKIGVEEENELLNIDTEELCRKILVVNNLTEKNNININKDTLIDKLIIDLWRCKNESSIN